MYVLLLVSQLAHAEEPPQVTALTREPTEEQRLEEFKERVVLFEDWVGVSASTGAIVSTWSVPKKGIYGEPLHGARFYDYIGEPEYAQSYRRRHTTSVAMRAGGVAVAAGGLAWQLASIGSMCWEEDDAACDQKFTRNQWIGRAMSGAGLASLVLSFTINPHPIADHERRKLATRFNQDLARELRLDTNAD